MKQFGKRKLRLKMRLTVIKNGTTIHKSTKQKKTAIYKEIRVFETQNPNKWKLFVSYGKTKTINSKLEELTNQGEYSTSSELLTALKIFTEKSLLNEIETWKGNNKNE